MRSGARLPAKDDRRPTDGSLQTGATTPGSLSSRAVHYAARSARMSESSPSREVSRRRFLTAAAATAALSALTACQASSTPAAKPADSKPAEAAKPAAPAAAPAPTQAPAAAAQPTQARVVPGQPGAAAPKP